MGIITRITLAMSTEDTALSAKRGDAEGEKARMMHMNNDVCNSPSSEIRHKPTGALFARNLFIVLCMTTTVVAVALILSFNNHHKCPADQGLHSDDNHCSREHTQNRSAPVVLPAGSHLWMFWDKGEADLRSHGDRHGSKYSLAWKCYTYWRALNPDLQIHLLDKETASAWSPEYRNLLDRDLPVQLMADVLRLDLLSLYGGVWTDVTVCPLHPLVGRLLDGTADFFMWHGPHLSSKSSFHKGVCTSPHSSSLNLHDNNRSSPPLEFGSFLVDNWFLVAPKTQNPLVEIWLAALLNTIQQLGDGSTPGQDYVYHLPHCVFTHLYADNNFVRMRYDAVSSCDVGYCQHNSNGVEFCEGLTSPCPREGAFLNEGADTTPDPLKLMYKGVSALAHMNWNAYDAYIKQVGAKTAEE